MDMLWTCYVQDSNILCTWHGQVLDMNLDMRSNGEANDHEKTETMRV